MTAPARTTRNDPMASGGKYCSPIFAAMKLNAHTTTINPMDAAMTMRPGVRPLADSICTASDQAFFSNGEFLDEVEPRFETDARTRGHANGALRRDRDFRSDDVFVPITLAGRNITGKRKIR